MKPESEKSDSAELFGIAVKPVGVWLLYAAGSVAMLVLALWLIKNLWGIV